MNYITIIILTLLTRVQSYRVAFPYRLGPLINKTAGWENHETIISPFLEKHFMLSRNETNIWSFTSLETLSTKFHNTSHGWISKCAYKRDTNGTNWNHLPNIERLGNKTLLWIFHEAVNETYYEWKQDKETYDPLKPDSLNVVVTDKIIMITGGYLCDHGISMLIPHRDVKQEDVPRLRNILHDNLL